MSDPRIPCPTNLLSELTNVMNQPTTAGQVRQLTTIMGQLTQLKNQVRSMGWRDWFTLTLAMLYIVSPLDLIPDPIPFLGLLDDLAVISSIVIPLLVNRNQRQN